MSGLSELVRTPKFAFFAVSLAITYPLDQLTKQLIARNFYYGETLPVIAGLFDLTYVRNPGGAFSFLATAGDWRLTFFISTTVLAVVLLLLFFRQLEGEARLSATALGVILGGALGNLTDRLLVGEVIDFLDVHLGSYTWPTFNLADSFIVVGVAVLMLEIFFEPDPEEAGPPAGQEEPTA